MREMDRPSAVRYRKSARGKAARARAQKKYLTTEKGKAYLARRAQTVKESGSRERYESSPRRKLLRALVYQRTIAALWAALGRHPTREEMCYPSRVLGRR